MRAPVGSVVGLCAASATMSAMGMAFLGYWGVHEPTPWNWKDILVVCFAFLSFASFGSTIWIITTPIPADGTEKIVPARRTFVIGLLLMWLAVIVAVVP
jgi:hypothetical protein